MPHGVTETVIAYNLESFLSKAYSTVNSETVLIANALHNYRESQQGSSLSFSLPVFISAILGYPDLQLQSYYLSH